jgi:hypothetical protein
MSRKKWLIGEDPFSQRLAVVPLELALSDIETIRTILTATTLGEVRRVASAYKIVEERYNNIKEPEDAKLASRPDETPFDRKVWYDDDGGLWYPLVRLRTAESAPPELLEEFGRADTEFGMDYERAPWFSVDDQAAVEARLTEMGYEVVHDDALLEAYLG